MFLKKKMRQFLRQDSLVGFSGGVTNDDSKCVPPELYFRFRKRKSCLCYESDRLRAMTRSGKLRCCGVNETWS